MLIAVREIPSSKTVSYKIIDKAGTIIQDWTVTGVTERVIDATAEASIYQVDSGAITTGFEGHVFWKTSDAIPIIASETINIQSVDVSHISGDSSAANNLEAQYDGTGYIHATAPAYQAQISAIAGGVAVRDNVAASVVVSGTASGTIANMNTDDDVRYVVTADAGTGALDFVLKVSPADTESMPVDIHFHGYYDEGTGATNSLTANAYNFNTASWEVVATLINAAVDIGFDLPLSVQNSAAGSGTILGMAYVSGDVLIRLTQTVNETGSTMNIDHLTVGFAGSPLTAEEVWAALTSALTTSGSIGKKLADWVLGSDSKVILSNNAHTGATVPTVTAVTNDVGVTQAGADKAWGTTARSLTDKAGFSLAADQLTVTVGTVNALGTQAKADVNAEVDSALNTAIPGSPTAGSVNEKVGSIAVPTPFTIVADTDNSTLQFKTNLASTVDDAEKGGWVRFTSGALAGLPPKRISTYNGTTKIITLSSSFVSAPATGVTGVIQIS